MWSWLPLLFLSIAGLIGQQPPSQQTAKPAIVSSDVPVDSLGETVYAHQGKEDKDKPIVPGVLTDPEPVKQVRPKLTKELKRRRFEGEITVLGVVAATGMAIDLKGQDGEDADATASALDAVRQYRFKPATLDGRPVAVRLKVIVNFKIF